MLQNVYILREPVHIGRICYIPVVAVNVEIHIFAGIDSECSSRSSNNRGMSTVSVSLVQKSIFDNIRITLSECYIVQN